MFKLFGKKSPAPQPDPTPEAAPLPSKHPEAAALAAQFGSEEFDILAVTGANSFGGEKEPDAEYRTATLPLTAWREEDGPIHQEDTCLVALADDTLLDYLRRRAPRDSIIQARVRKGLEDDRFLLVGLPTPMMDPELKAILEEQKKEVSQWVEGLGTFVLNRSVNWFQADGEWLGQDVQFIYDNGPEEEQKAAQAAALSMVSDARKWDERLRVFSADSLLEQMNDWARDEAQEGEEPEELTREDFMDRMEPESLQVWSDGRFEFWFHDRDYQWEHSLRVVGTLADGPSQVHMEG